MAGLQQGNQSGDADVAYGGRLTWFVIASCAMAAVGGLIFGYDIGISGGVTSMAPFLAKFFPIVYKKMETNTKNSNYCKFNSESLTAFTSSLYVAGLFASFLASWTTRSYGRKPSIIAGGIAFLAGSASGGAASNIYMLIFGRVLLGIGVGFANQSVPLYLSEMAPARYRGAFNNGFQLSISIGFLSANLINYGTEKIKAGYGWRISLALAAVPALFLTAGALFLPETPNSLIQITKNDKKAKLILQRIRGTISSSNNMLQAELDDLIVASTRSGIADKKLIFKRKYRPQLVMAIAIPFFQQVTGINVIAFYAPVLFRTLGFGESASLLSSVMTGTVGMVSTIVSMLVVDRFGRRALFMFGGVQMFVSQLVIGGIMAAKLDERGEMSEPYGYAIVVLICVYVAGFGWSWGPLAWLVPSEIFPLEIRSIGQSVAVGVSFVFTFIVAQCFLDMLCHFKAGIFFFFGGWVLVMTGFVYGFLPETRNLPIEKMDRIWEEHWFWKRFSGKNGEVDHAGGMGRMTCFSTR